MVNPEDDDFYEPISYKKFIRTMETYHPMDPNTKKKFDFDSRITVKDYWAKLSDVLFCYELYLQYKKFKRWLR